MNFARLDDLEICYEMRGSGPPLLLIAGYTCDHTFWDAMVPELAKRFQVVTFDNRGIGRTKDSGKSFSVETMASDTAQLIRYLQLPRPAVVAQSMGGAIAQILLARHPDLIGKCAILNSTQTFSQATLMLLEDLLALRRADVDFDFLIDASLRLLSGFAWLSEPKNIESFKAALRQNPAPQTLEDQGRQLAALRTFGEGVGSMPPHRDATLVVSATEDLLTPPREGQALAAKLGARFVEIPGGHPSPLEQPERLLQILREFLHE